jgi:hypothetical protein
MKWIKYSVQTLNKTDCYYWEVRVTVVPFLLGWSSDSDGMYYMLALFQDAIAWGNESCWTSSLLFPEVRGPAGQPPRTVKPPTPDVNYTSCLSRQGDD